MSSIHHALRAPFPWFGGKSSAAAIAWEALGSPHTYIEPFAGSLAALLARPSQPHHEIVNDADGFVVNAWRAIQANPDAVADHCTWPLSEVDLRARWQWLRDEWAAGGRLAAELRANPRWYDAEVAGWWVWGQSGAIGDGWRMSGGGPHLPQITSTGTGVLAIGRRGLLHEWMGQLSERLRHVRIACGDWTRVAKLSGHPQGRKIGVFLDPPYGATGQVGAAVYNASTNEIAADVREWAISNGDRSSVRIVLCGYDDEHAMPATWTCVGYRKQRGAGYGNRTAHGRANARRERLWLSPHCNAVEVAPHEVIT